MSVVGTTGYGQRGNEDLLTGKWVEMVFPASDSCNLDSMFWGWGDKQLSYNGFDSLFVQADTIETIEWDIEFFDNGNYNENDRGFCDGTEYMPSGKWKADHAQITMINDNPCEDLSMPSHIIAISGWLSPNMFYECLGREGENGPYIIVFYSKVIKNTK